MSLITHLEAELTTAMKERLNGRGLMFEHGTDSFMMQKVIRLIGQRHFPP